jgi:hypothetical protein
VRFVQALDAVSGAVYRYKNETAKKDLSQVFGKMEPSPQVEYTIRQDHHVW